MLQNKLNLDNLPSWSHFENSKLNVRKNSLHSKSLPVCLHHSCSSGNASECSDCFNDAFIENYNHLSFRGKLYSKDFEHKAPISSSSQVNTDCEPYTMVTSTPNHLTTNVNLEEALKEMLTKAPNQQTAFQFAKSASSQKRTPLALMNSPARMQPNQLVRKKQIQKLNENFNLNGKEN